MSTIIITFVYIDLYLIIHYILSMKELLTVKDVMSEYSIGIATVYNWFKRGLVKTKIGRMTRIKRSDLDAFIEGGKA